MGTPADQRLLELLDKWLSSLDLHLKYASLDDETYRKIQPWVEHQRPSRWIIDLAKHKTLALRAEVQKRMEASDAGFSDAVELMAFLANLVGSQHIERFIPLADAGTERWISNEATPIAKQPADETREMPVLTPVPASSNTATVDMLKPEKPAVGATATREMPRFFSESEPAAAQAAPAPATAQVTRVERKNADPAPPPRPAPAQAHPLTPKPAPKHPAKPASKVSGKPAARSTAKPADSGPSLSSAALDQVIADAVRLTQWGRKWYELAELISGMADRPSLPDVRRVLKDHKATIDKMAGR